MLHKPLYISLVPFVQLTIPKESSDTEDEEADDQDLDPRSRKKDPDGGAAGGDLAEAADEEKGHPPPLKQTPAASETKKDSAKCRSPAWLYMQQSTTPPESPQAEEELNLNGELEYPTPAQASICDMPNA